MHYLPLFVAFGLLAALGAGLFFGYRWLDRVCKRACERLDVEIAVKKFQRQHAYQELGAALEDSDFDVEGLPELARQIGRGFRLGLGL